MLIYVGTNRMPGVSDGIHLVDFTLQKHAFEWLEVLPLANPSYLAISRETNTLYAATHTAAFEGSLGAGIIAYRIAPDDGRLSRLNSRLSPFPHVCDLSIDTRSKLLLSASGLGGGISAFLTSEDGQLISAVNHTALPGLAQLRLGQTIGDLSTSSVEELVRDRKKFAIPHCIVVDPSGRYALVADVGANRIHVFEVQPAGNIRSTYRSGVTAHAGAGPRNIVFHPSGRLFYVSNEDDSTVSVYYFAPETGYCVESKFVSAVSGSEKPGLASDLTIDDAGKHIYVGNRRSNSIATLAIGDSSSDLELVGADACGGEHPRYLTVVPGAGVLLVANQGDFDFESGPRSSREAMGICSFELDSRTGRPELVGTTHTVPLATCVVW
jgi:6-phosphogluconolactonase